MSRIIIFIDFDRIQGNKSLDYVQFESSLENIFDKISSVISSNDVALTFNYKHYKLNTTTGIASKGIYDGMIHGGIMYILASVYNKIKYEHGLSKDITPVLSRTLVDARNLNEKNGKTISKFLAKPLDILEKSAISSLLYEGYMPVTLINGGIPVLQKLQYYQEFTGEIDACAASSLLAVLVEADTLLIVTSYRCISIIENNKLVDIQKIRYDDMKKYFYNNNFKNADMKNKVYTSLDFLEKGGKYVYINSANNIMNGTYIHA